MFFECLFCSGYFPIQKVKILVNTNDTDSRGGVKEEDFSFIYLIFKNQLILLLNYLY